MTVGELVESMKGEDRFRPAFEGAGASGIGGSGGAGGAGGSESHTISTEDARNPHAYRTAKAAALKAGTTLTIT